MNLICPICSNTLKSYDISSLERYEIWKCDIDNLFHFPRALYSGGNIYTSNYHLHYRLYGLSDLGKKLNEHRWKFVNKNFPELRCFLDFGCGSESFAKITPPSVRGYSYDPFFHSNMAFMRIEHLDVITFWDSLEHIRRLDIVRLLKTNCIIISLPIFDEKIPDIRHWRHYNPEEHVWGFTEKALINLMSLWNYKLVDKDDFEIRLGRKDIYSYCFKRM